jgi:hypothetical protein
MGPWASGTAPGAASVRRDAMKAFLLYTANGPVVILASHDFPADDIFVGKLRAKAVDKFLAFELPLDEVQEKCGGHFQTVLNDLHETDDLRILDFNGQRVFQRFPWTPSIRPTCTIRMG